VEEDGEDVDGEDGEGDGGAARSTIGRFHSHACAL
jgi:hypothetical protein